MNSCDSKKKNKRTMTNKTIREALDEIKIAFDNFCIDAEAIINEAKQKEVKNGRNKGRRKESSRDE